jgi:hypothetical protein
MAFRTQKISQMTPKGADLEATDLIEVSTIESGSYVTRSITGQELIDAIPLPPSGLTIGTTPIASGTIGRVLFQGTGNVLQQSGNLFWDNTNLRLGINGTPTSPLEIFYNPTGISNTIGLTLNSGSTGSTLKAIRFTAGTFGELGTFGVNTGSGEFRWATSASYFPTIYSNGAERLRIPTTGNVLINTTTDAGFKLDVNGTARVSGLVTATLSNYNSTHSGNTTRGFYIVNSADSIVRAGIEYDGTNAFVQLAGRFANGAPFFRQDGGNGNISFLRNGVEFGRFFGTGNLGVNTGTDAGFRLDVNGTARFTGNVQADTYIKFATGWIRGASNQFLVYDSGLNIKTSINLASGTSYFNTGGNFVFGAASANASAIVQADSTTQGFLPPRMTTTQRNAISSPAAGLMVYDTTLNAMFYFNGTIWI